MLEKYAAKLLFQFRVVVSGVSSKRRICEERIVLIQAESESEAVSEAKKIGVCEEHEYRNNDGNMVFFEFIGVRDLVKLGIECQENEVWYEIKEYLMPMERKDRFIPDEKILLDSLKYGVRDR